MKTKEKLVLATLKYHDFFSFPLTLKEINKYQIAEFSALEKKPSLAMGQKELKKILVGLKRQKKIGQKQSWYFLFGREKLVELRKKRQRISQKKMKIGLKIGKIFAFIPWVRAVVVTGALAMENCPENDDIDLMVITAANRLWLARPILLLILALMGKRRKPKTSKVKNKICLNIFLEKSAFKLKKSQQNLFIAHEISQAKPIINKNNIWQEFLRQNLWLERYLPHSLVQAKIKIGFKNKSKSGLKKKKGFFFFLNQLAFWLQYQYMKKKITREKIGLNYAFFHPRDRGKIIKAKMLKLIRYD